MAVSSEPIRSASSAIFPSCFPMSTKFPFSFSKSAGHLSTTHRKGSGVSSFKIIFIFQSKPSFETHMYRRISQRRLLPVSKPRHRFRASDRLVYAAADRSHPSWRCTSARSSAQELVSLTGAQRALSGRMNETRRTHLDAIPPIPAIDSSLSRASGSAQASHCLCRTAFR
jgi:hypothetical protein